MNQIKCPNCLKRCKTDTGLKLHLNKNVCYKHQPGNIPKNYKDRYELTLRRNSYIDGKYKRDHIKSITLFGDEVEILDKLIHFRDKINKNVEVLE